MFQSEIHQRVIDSFYFNDFVPKLQPYLRTLALDTRVLYHAKEARQIKSLADVYGGQYMLMPWLLEDTFQLPDDQRRVLAQAFTLFFIGYIINDHLVDRQTPDAPMVALFSHHLLLGAHEQFAAVFDSAHPFWAEYYRNTRDIFNNLALEAYCLERHEQNYTAELIEQVSAAKAAPFRVLGAERLVPQEQCRPADQRPAKCSTLLLSPRQLRRPPVEQHLHLQQRGDIRDAGSDLA
jgi:hypothetical protein